MPATPTKNDAAHFPVDGVKERYRSSRPILAPNALQSYASPFSAGEAASGAVASSRFHLALSGGGKQVRGCGASASGPAGSSLLARPSSSPSITSGVASTQEGAASNPAHHQAGLPGGRVPDPGSPDGPPTSPPRRGRPVHGEVVVRYCDGPGEDIEELASQMAGDLAGLTMRQPELLAGVAEAAS